MLHRLSTRPTKLDAAKICEERGLIGPAPRASPRLSDERHRADKREAQPEREKPHGEKLHRGILSRVSERHQFVSRRFEVEKEKRPACHGSRHEKEVYERNCEQKRYAETETEEPWPIGAKHAEARFEFEAAARGGPIDIIEREIAK